MKRILFTGSAMLFAMLASAQLTQGTVTYDRTVQMQMQINGDDGGPPVARTRSDKFELSFGDNKSLWKQAEKENDDADNFSQGGGAQVRMVVAGSDDVLFNDFTTHKSTELRVFMDKKFIVDDSTRPLKWKIGEETKTILNHVCRVATATSVSSRMTMNINNGVMEKKEVPDTSVVTAWFAADIPAPAGPAIYQGQLPGLILALDVNNGRVVYRAVEISEKVNLASIKEPTGKKHYTAAEFRKERDKIMEDLQQNSRGGNVQIRMN